MGKLPPRAGFSSQLLSVQTWASLDCCVAVAGCSNSTQTLFAEQLVAYSTRICFFTLHVTS